MGKDSNRIPTAMLYLASKNKGEKRTQTQIASIARIPEVTLRTHAKQIRNKLQNIPRE